MTTIERNVAAGVLTAVAVYLKSPFVAAMPVILYGVHAAEIIYGRFQKDADVQALVVRAEAYEKRLRIMEMDLTNVAERAKNILGENY